MICKEKTAYKRVRSLVGTEMSRRDRKEATKAKADELGIKLSTYAGKIDGDHETQVRAVETCIASGAKGILIAASDTKAITTVLGQAQDNGLLAAPYTHLTIPTKSRVYTTCIFYTAKTNKSFI